MKLDLDQRLSGKYLKRWGIRSACPSCEARRELHDGEITGLGKCAYTMKPSAVVVKAGSQASVVINLAVLSTINSQAIQELLECLRIYLSAGGNEIAAAIAHAHVRASMNGPRIRVNRRLSITTKLPFTEDAHILDG
jgi:hypothetical protein